jgi:F-type H+-transporting ATPase subunit gamma
MASLRDIRKRIKSVKSTRQITRAVKMVAAAKLRRAQDAIIAARPYASTLDKMIAEVMSRTEAGNVAHPLLAKREVKKIEVLLMTSDRGLAGGFNSNVNRRALKFLTESGTKYEVTITSIGRKGGDFFRARGFKIRKDYPGMMNKVTYQGAADVAEELSARFLKGEIDAVYLANNEFVSAISQRINFAQLLPFEAAPAVAGGEAKTDYLYEPNAQAVLDKLVPQALKIKIFRALLDSVASEHGARMTAMENATKNAGEMIGKLTLFYNRTRQAAITKELMEIVSGAEALK